MPCLLLCLCVSFSLAHVSLASSVQFSSVDLLDDSHTPLLSARCGGAGCEYIHKGTRPNNGRGKERERCGSGESRKSSESAPLHARFYLLHIPSYTGWWVASSLAATGTENDHIQRGREGSRRRLFGRDSIIHLLLNPCSTPEQRLPFVRETTAAVKAKRGAQHIGRMSDWGQDKARENHSVRPQMSCT